MSVDSFNMRESALMSREVAEKRRHPRERMYYLFLSIIGFFSFFTFLFFVTLFRFFAQFIFLSVMRSLGAPYMGTFSFEGFIRPFFFYFLYYFAFYLLFIRLLSYWAEALLLGYVRSIAIKVTKRQFPLLFEEIEKQSKKFGMKKSPEAYVLNGSGFLNAFAVRLLRKNHVILYSEVVVAAKKNSDVASFIVAHELAHIYLGHTYFWRNFFIFRVPFLYLAYSRAREYSCDALGAYIAPKGARQGLFLLLTGRHLVNDLSIDVFVETAKGDQGFCTRLFELFFATHPSIAKRLDALDRWLPREKKPISLEESVS